jgi:hypothetical protein
MGLLDQFFGSPDQTTALGLLGAHMMAGNAPAGYQAALGLLAQAPDKALERQYKQGQVKEQEIAQALQKYQLQRLQNWDREINGGGSAPEIPAGAVSSPGAFVPPAAGGVGPVLPPSEAPAALTQPGFRYGLPGRTDQQSRAVAGAMTPDAYMKIFADQTAPQTDVAKLLAAQGIDPSSPIGKQYLQGALDKANYIAPVNARLGSILRSPTTGMPFAFNPHIPDGSTPTFDAAGNVIGMRQINGALPAISGLETAKTMGVAEATPTVAYDASGNPIFSTKATDVRRAGGQPPADADRTLIFTNELKAAQGRLAAARTPEESARATNDIAGLQREMQRNGMGAQPAGQTAPAAPAAPMVTPQLRPGVNEGAKRGQDEMSTRWAALNESNAQAESTKSYLQTIKQLAATAATGPFSSKVQFTNALLGFVGNERATDATTANNLLDKYSNQIVARLGTGGMGTDAARTILQSAYPNAHMTPQAINEAADNIIGAQSMMQAKAKLLQPHASSRDPAAYSQKELTFDQNADPRIWQLQSMDGASAKHFLSSLPANVQADLRRKVNNLKMLGAL